jgi:hypothetical protein
MRVMFVGRCAVLLRVGEDDVGSGGMDFDGVAVSLLCVEIFR